MGELHFGILFVLGLSLLGGTLGAWFFQRIRVPQVVGYIVAGLVVGGSGFGIVDADTIAKLRPLNLFALGVIGFLVGGELKLDEFRRYGRQFAAILLGEGMLAFVLVSIPTGLILYGLTSDSATALAGGIVFGAIASATDPASTIDVLWEYRCRGVLTTSITAVVALDDALAMTLYAVGTGSAAIIVGGQADILAAVGHVGAELAGALILGGLVALALNQLLRWIEAGERALGLALGAILFMNGMAATFGLDVILASMGCGFVLANLAPRRSEDLFKIVRGFSGPIYVLFFALVGARLSPQHMPAWLLGIVAVYVVGRSLGKLGGSWLGAKLTGSTDNVRRYLGLGLFAQGGVAVGLSIVASQKLEGIALTPDFLLSDAIVFGITTTTLIVQLLGPPCVKYAVEKAGEAGRNRTEDDVLRVRCVREWMTPQAPTIGFHRRLREAIEQLSSQDSHLLLVTNEAGEWVGSLTIQGLRGILQEPSAWEWLLVADVVEPPAETARTDETLLEAVWRMRQAGLDTIPVVEQEGSRRVVGLLDLHSVRKRVETELLHGEVTVAKKPEAKKPAARPIGAEVRHEELKDAAADDQPGTAGLSVPSDEDAR